jgi:hypothetical protein
VQERHRSNQADAVKAMKSNTKKRGEGYKMAKRANETSERFLALKYGRAEYEPKSSVHVGTDSTCVIFTSRN